MNKNLPPPNWSPTGESGYWVWCEQGQYVSRTDTWEPKWKWFTEEEYKERGWIDGLAKNDC